MSCGCGGRQASPAPTLAPKKRNPEPGETWEVRFHNGATQTVASEQMAQAVVAVNGGQYQRIN